MNATLYKDLTLETRTKTGKVEKFYREKVVVFQVREEALCLFLARGDTGRLFLHEEGRVTLWEYSSQRSLSKDLGLMEPLLTEYLERRSHLGQNENTRHLLRQDFERIALQWFKES